MILTKAAATEAKSAAGEDDLQTLSDSLIAQEVRSVLCCTQMHRSHSFQDDST